MPWVLTSTQSESLNTLLHVWHHFTDNGQFLRSFWCTRKYSFETCRSGFRGSLWSKLSTTDQVEVSPSDSSWLTLLNFIGVTCEVGGSRVNAKNFCLTFLYSPFSTWFFFQTSRQRFSVILTSSRKKLIFVLLMPIQAPLIPFYRFNKKIMIAHC